MAIQIVRRLKNVISAYKESKSDVSSCKILNGITFYYYGFLLTDEIIEQLENFSLSSEAEDEAYSVYFDYCLFFIF